MRFLGFIFLSLIGSSVLLVADHFIPGNFLQDFINKSYIETLGILLGLNTTAAIFLLGQMAEIEFRYENKVSFRDTKKELKHNIFFMIFGFLISFILLTVRPNILDAPPLYKIIIFYAINGLILSVFFLVLYAIYEVFAAAFIMSSVKSK